MEKSADDLTPTERAIAEALARMIVRELRADAAATEPAPPVKAAGNSTEAERRFVSLRQLKAITGLSATTLWRLRQRGELPEPMRLSPGRVAWPEDVIKTWLESRPARTPGSDR